MQGTVEKTTEALRSPEEVELMPSLRAAWQARVKILALTVSVTILVAALSFLIPNVYTAKATIMPTSSSNDRINSALASLGALGSLAAQGSGLKGTVSDKFVAFIESRTLTEHVLRRGNLWPLLFPEEWDGKRLTWKRQPSVLEAYRRIEKIMRTKVDAKTGVVQISVSHRDPQFAADLANAYVLELSTYVSGNSLTSAKRNQLFLESQVKEVTGQLGQLEDELKSFQKEHKIVSLDAQAEAGVQAYADLKSQLAGKEIQLNLLSTSLPSGDPQLVALKREVAQIRQKVAAIESGKSDGIISFKDAPDLGMRYARIKRDLLVKEKVFETLTEQLELAKVDAAKDDLSFQVIDRAVPPDEKSWPQRGLIVAFTAAFTALMGVTAVMVKSGKNVSLRT